MSKAKNITENNEYVITFSIIREVACCMVFQEYTEDLGIYPFHLKISLYYVENVLGK